MLKVAKVPGTANAADLITKHVPKELVDKYAALLGFEFVGGREATATCLHLAEESGAREPSLAARRCSCTSPLQSKKTEVGEGKHWHCISAWPRRGTFK